MPILLFVVGILDIYYYDIGETPDLEEVYEPIMEASTGSPGFKRERRAMVGAFLGLGLLEFILALATTLLIWCCAKTYKIKDYASGRKLAGAHNPIPKKFNGGLSLPQKNSRSTVLPQPPPQ
jgi:hypothetical protein